MRGNLLRTKRMSRSFNVICLMLAMLITLQAAGITTKAAEENGPSTTARFLKEIVVDAQVNENTKWGIRKDEVGGDIETRVSKIKNQYNKSYFDEEHALEISSAEDLAAFAVLVNSSTSDETYDFAGKYVKMTTDINLGGSGLTCTEEQVEYNNDKFKITYAGTIMNAWSPIGTYVDSNTSRPFKGTFNGNGHEIKNMIVLNERYAGLFGYTEGATVKNLGINEDSYVVASNYAGGIIGMGKKGGTTITNSYVSGTISASSSYYCYAGGLVGDCINAEITNSYSVGTVSSFSCSYYCYAGGLVGSVCNGNVRIKNSYSAGAVFSCSGASSSNAGGLVGHIYGSANIVNSYVEGTILSSSYYYCYAGGLIGDCISAEVINSYLEGIVSSYSSCSSYCYAGGTIGSCVVAKIANSYAKGAVSSYSCSPFAGGLVGHCDNIEITNSYSAEEVLCRSSSFFSYVYAGGLVGSCSPVNRVSYEGKKEKKVIIESSYASGTIFNTSANRNYIGGLIGKIDMNSSIIVSNSFWNGTNSANEAIGNYALASSNTYGPKTYQWMINSRFLDDLNSDMYIAWDGHTPTFKAGRSSAIKESVSDNENLWALLQNWVDSKSSNTEQSNNYEDWIAYCSKTSNCYKRPSFLTLPAEANVEIDSENKDLVEVGETISLGVSISWKEIISQGIIKRLCEKPSMLEITDPDGEKIKILSVANVVGDKNITINFNHKFFKSGEHTIKFIYPGDNIFKEASVTKSILAEKADMSDAKVFFEKGDRCMYTGQEQRPKINVIFDCGPLQLGTDYDVEYLNNVDVGTATVIVTGKNNFKGSVEEHFKIRRLSIARNRYSVQGEYNDVAKTWIGQSGKLIVTPTNGYSLCRTKDGNYSDRITLSPNKVTWKGGEKTAFYVREESTKYIGKVILKEGRDFYIDSIPPIANIKICKNKWNIFLNVITFGTFFKSNMDDIFIEATDDKSGVRSTEYVITDNEYDEDSIKGAEIRWIEYRGKISVENLEKKIVYIKVTDNVGNVTYISSRGLVEHRTALDCYQ